jgi:hypothetical protein
MRLSCKVLYISLAANIANPHYQSWFVSVRSPLQSHLLAIQLHWPMASVLSMPSFVYVARIARFSEEQAEGLRSAGFHVKSFGPGEITTDACFMVMTSEALLSSPYQAGSGTAAGNPASQDATPQDKIPAPGMPVPSMNEELGSQAAIWHIIKTAAANESAARNAENHQQSSRRKFVIEPEPVNLGLIPTAVGQRVFSALRPTPAGNSEPSPMVNTPVENARGSVSFPLFMHSPDKRHQPWRPMATVATLLICALVLLTHRAATLPSTIEPASEFSNESRGGDGSSHLTVQPSGVSLSSAEGSRVSAAAVRRHPSDYDFVAEDFTNRFDPHTHSRATLQTPDLKHDVHRGAERKRIVNN